MDTIRNIRLTVQYDGSAFHGWQRQKGLRTVQETLERGIAKLTKEHVVVHGAGRTDAGVHALGMQANFISASPIPVDRWCVALNSILPTAVRVSEASIVASDWHARFTSHWTSYRYTIDRSTIPSPLRRNFTWQRYGEMDHASLHASADLVVGNHNFKAFCASGSKVMNHQRTITRSSWVEEGDLLHYDITGNGFLYNMVRLLVGGMTDIASDKWSLEGMSQALQSGERKGTLFCAPPQGLCLMSIIYESDVRPLDNTLETS